MCLWHFTKVTIQIVLENEVKNCSQLLGSIFKHKGKTFPRIVPDYPEFIAILLASFNIPSFPIFAYISVVYRAVYLNNQRHRLIPFCPIMFYALFTQIVLIVYMYKGRLSFMLQFHKWPNKIATNHRKSRKTIVESI